MDFYIPVSGFRFLGGLGIYKQRKNYQLTLLEQIRCQWIRTILGINSTQCLYRYIKCLGKESQVQDFSLLVITQPTQVPETGSRIIEFCTLKSVTV